MSAGCVRDEQGTHRKVLRLSILVQAEEDWRESLLAAALPDKWTHQQTVQLLMQPLFPPSHVITFVRITPRLSAEITQPIRRADSSREMKRSFAPALLCQNQN